MALLLPIGILALTSAKLGFMQNMDREVPRGMVFMAWHSGLEACYWLYKSIFICLTRY